MGMGSKLMAKVSATKPYINCSPNVCCVPTCMSVLVCQWMWIHSFRWATKWARAWVGMGKGSSTL